MSARRARRPGRADGRRWISRGRRAFEEKLQIFVAAGVLTLELRRHRRRILNFCLMAFGGDPPDAMRTNPCANGHEDRGG
jgi:hypothetical protein